MAVVKERISHEESEASQPTARLYEPLNTFQDEIRLLEILPEPAEDGSVSCRLFTTSLTRELEYSALSYVWGESEVRKKVTVNGLSIDVTTNLANALLNIRSTILPLLEAEGTAPYIWADALCINQTDIIERNEQVMRMGKIYKSASHVLSWLECGNDEIRLGLQTIREIADNLKANGVQAMSYDPAKTRDTAWIDEFLRDSPGLCQRNARDGGCGSFDNHQWDAVYSVMGLTYWKRLWILQETVLAKDPESHWLFHDDELVTYSSFDLFTTLVQAMAKSMPPSTMDPTLWFCLMEYFKMTKFSLVNEFKHVYDNPNLVHMRKITLVMMASLQFACKDPHDLFYGLLGVLPIQMEPDYRKSMRQVYLEWAKDLIVGSAESAVLFLPFSGTSQHQQNEYNLPSWLPDLHHRRNYTGVISLKTKFSFTDYLPFWFQPISLQNEDILCIHGTRCGEINDIVRLNENPEEKFTRLFLYVFFNKKGDLEAGVSQLQALFTVMLACWGEGRPDFSAIETQLLAVAFIKTYLANTKGLDLIQEAMQRVKTRTWSGRSTLVDAVLTELFSPNHPAPDYESFHREPFTPMMTTAMVHIQTIVAKMQCLFRLPSGHLGGGPLAMRAGDKVCVLAHCKSPVILRQSGANWIHVGTCFVLGLSDGEAYKMIDEGKLKVEEFLIC
jgi:hypothetical protein